MNKRFLLYAVLVAPMLPAMASTINVTNSSQVTLGTGDSLIFDISTNGAHGPFDYPAEIDVLLGGMPTGGPVSSIPGTSGVYIGGMLFTGTLQSQDGAISIPLTDANAPRLGLPGGDMLLIPGSHGGGSYSGPIDLISGNVTISSREAAAMFAPGEVVIELHNTGAPITFGYPGSSIASDFTASLVTSNGAQSVGARVTGVECVHAPEPGTIGLLLMGLSLLGARWARARS